MDIININALLAKGSVVKTLEDGDWFVLSRTNNGQLAGPNPTGGYPLLAISKNDLAASLGSGFETRGTVTRLAVDGGGTQTVTIGGRLQMIYFNAVATLNFAFYSDGRSDGVMNNCTYHRPVLNAGNPNSDQTNCIHIINGYTAVVNNITDTSFDIVWTVSGGGLLDVSVQFMAFAAANAGGGGGGGGISAANNGLNINGSTVQWGGPLVKNTTIDSGNFDFNFYNSSNGWEIIKRTNTNYTIIGGLGGNSYLDNNQPTNLQLFAGGNNISSTFGAAGGIVLVGSVHNITGGTSDTWIFGDYGDVNDSFIINSFGRGTSFDGCTSIVNVGTGNNITFSTNLTVIGQNSTISDSNKVYLANNNQFLTLDSAGLVEAKSFALTIPSFFHFQTGFASTGGYYVGSGNTLNLNAASQFSSTYYDQGFGYMFHQVAIGSQYSAVDHVGNILTLYSDNNFGGGGGGSLVLQENILSIGGASVGIGTATPTSILHVVGLPIYANNAAAIGGGLTAGAFYTDGAGAVLTVF